MHLGTNNVCYALVKNVQLLSVGKETVCLLAETPKSWDLLPTEIVQKFMISLMFLT